MSRVLILGIDGYIGYSLALDLLSEGYEVCGLDNLTRRRFVADVGSDSLTPIASFADRSIYLRGHINFIDSVATINLSDYYLIERVLHEYKPDTIVHLAEQPSAPWSMRGPRYAVDTQIANVAGTLALLWAMKKETPDAHLVKLGTMGEYGTPNCDIPEGFIPDQPCFHIKSLPIEMKEVESGKIIKLTKTCPMKGLPFPKQAGSFYHLSKVHDTNNINFACKTWNLRATDIMQGVVFGLNTTNVRGDEPLFMTRFDYDQYFGTVINRFCVQAIVGHPLTIYGTGQQIRGFLPLRDSIWCLKIAMDNPPEFGEYRVFNQFESIYTIRHLADAVSLAAEEAGIKRPETKFLPNPRTEADKHYYNPTREHLAELGYEPFLDMYKVIYETIVSLIPFKDRINQNVIMPTTTWR